MKWGIIILVVLGAVAAACAALLVGAIGGNSSAAAKGVPGVEVAVAKKSLPAMTVVTLDHVAKQAVARNELPQGQGQLVSPSRVVGRVLQVPVVEGQVLTESCFVSEGTGAQLAAALPEGMRAFTINLNSRAIPDQLLLYPGCVVDVLFSSKLSSRDIRGEALSATILRGIQVLAVEGDSVVSSPEAEGEAKARRSGGSLQVTLLVDPKQAEALQLAVDNGNISLAIRNPLDKGLGDMEATVLSQGRLATLSSLLTTEGLAASQKQRGTREWLASQIVGAQNALQQATQETAGKPNETGFSAAPMTPPQPRMDDESLSRRNPRWGITVIRGKETKTEELDVPAAANQAK